MVNTKKITLIYIYDRMNDLSEVAIIVAYRVEMHQAREGINISMSENNFSLRVFVGGGGI